ncbi:uncharacterized protein MELLADRAFT_116699 [Melampsora larici-populina 98AG31]|uniref:C2H2-type domain-containing protein n=1 Tax=Melampsora larici-populina (strain 98AG31 / pathotype 3-4-7) TaxID=747676 RepID=F4RP79_MELLP|nr:uncharacterized protein MELLADRAFT_116699 [Melampsora larici-populina 98AG31]EGG05770.1 hypothetical protein MELLADRAFT_116699 [Melampsora larici-populina 98AG31]
MNNLSTFFFQNLDPVAGNFNEQSLSNAEVSKSDSSNGLRSLSRPVEETTIDPSVLNTLGTEEVDFFNKFLGFTTTPSVVPNDPQVDLLNQILGMPTTASAESPPLIQNPDNLDYLFGDEAEDSNTSNSSSLDLDQSEVSQEVESKAPELYRSTSSSTPEFHGDHSSELSSAPANSFKDHQHQQYNIPPLQVFTRPLGMEDDPLIEHSPRLSQMMRYPDEIPIVTLGRGKKNTRSLIEMSEGEMEEALHGLNPSQSRQAKQQQAIKEWNGACQSALTNEIPQHQDWNSKNKLHLTVNTAPDHQSQLDHQSFNNSIRQQYSLSGNANRVMEGVMMAPPRSAPPEIRHHTYNYLPNQHNGIDHPNVTLALPTPPLSAGIHSNSNHGFDFSSYGRLSAPGYMGPNSLPLTRSMSDYGAVPMANLKSPSNYLNVNHQYLQMQPNQKREFEKSSFGQAAHLNNSLALPTPPLSAGLSSGTSLDFFDFSNHSIQGSLSHLGTNHDVHVNMATTSNPSSVPSQSSFQTYPTLPLRSNINNPLSGQFKVQENQSRTRTISFGLEENPSKRRSIDPNQRTDLQQENLSTQIALKPKLIGSRLKPGPKAKSTIVQHPPIQAQCKLSNNGVSEIGSLPKDVIRCLYNHLDQMGEDGKMIKNYVCQIEGCGRVFPRKTAIESHIQTHLEDKPFVCPVLNCNAAFVRQHDLRRHEHIHSGNKPFRCECNKGFARGDALMRHRQRGICIGSTIPRRC